MKKRVLSLMLAAGMLAALAACGNGDSGNSTAPDASTSPDSTASTPADTTSSDLATLANQVSVNPNVGQGLYPGTSEAGSVTVECSTMSVMNPILQTYNTEFSVSRHMWDALVKLDANNNVVGAAAESWESSDDGLTWTFHLREGMKWVDSTGAVVGDVTANDFVFAWSELLNPANAAEYYNFAIIFKNAQAYYDYMSGVEGAEEVTLDEVGFRAVDELTLEIELENYLPYLLQYLKFEVMSPIYQPFYEEVGADRYGTSPDTLLYSGPFRMTNWVTENTITLEKNDEWWDADNVSISEINFVKYTDTNTKYNAFLSGEIDIIDITGEQRAMFEAEGFTPSSYVGGYSYYFFCNNLTQEQIDANPDLYSNAKLSDMRSPSLRKAVSAALNREQIISTVFKNDNQPSACFTFGITSVDGGSFSDVVVAANGGQPLYSPTSEPEVAQEYLAAALEELGYSDVSEIHISLLTSEGTENELFSQVVQEQLRTVLGIENVDIDVVTITEARARRNAVNFDMFMGGWGPDYNDPMTFLDIRMTDNGNNHTGYSNPEYDALIESTKAETDPEAREQLFVQAELMLAEDMPVVPVYWRYEDYVASEKLVSGYIRKSFQGYYLAYTTLAE